MKTIVKQNRTFLFLYLIFLIIGAVLLISTTKHQLHLLFNQFHNSFLDSFFYYATFLGDGIAAVLVVIMFLAVKYRIALIVAISNLVAALITQTLKHTIFDDVVRPKKFFEGIQDLYFVPGVENYMYNSFPSGHTTCAFALYFSLALFTKSKWIEFLLFSIALIVGYSRVYLSQHFFVDIYAGSIIGVATTLLVYFLFRNMKAQWLDKSLINSFNAN